MSYDDGNYDRVVSIHALRVECDLHTYQPGNYPCGFNPRTPCGVRPALSAMTGITKSFNPRTPCGVRPLTTSGMLYAILFQSTHSVWSATPTIMKRWYSIQFQSTHSVWSATCAKSPGYLRNGCFNPRTPCGVRRLRVWHRFKI